MRMTSLLCAALGAFGATTTFAQAPSPTSPAPRQIAKDTYLLPGGFQPGRGPDGNTVMFVGPRGLVVVDTGRHAWHSDAIIAFAREQKREVVDIVNTHWHLDHNSGNARIKAAFPNARVHATDAVDRALAPEGFLARELARGKAAIGDDKLDAVTREELQLAIDTIEHGDNLRPDVVTRAEGTRKLAGRKLDVRVTHGAVTDADVWLYDAATHVAVLGDLVTLPAPFFETACPARWRESLDEVWATSFKTAIPGHGEPMTRDDFNAYRLAFGAFIDCVNTDLPADSCAAGWTQGIDSLLKDDKARRVANAYAAYYVDFLRKGHGKSADCRA